MDELEHKLAVLARLARVLNGGGVVWALGGSALLYLRGRTDGFHDLDLMVLEADAERAGELLAPLGAAGAARPAGQYRSRFFLELTVEGVEVDVIAGFAIVKDGAEYDCSLTPEAIAGTVPVLGEPVPLQSLSDWKRYYQLMGRTARAAQLADC